MSYSREEYTRKYYQEHKEKILQDRKKYYIENRETILAREKAYYWKHRDKFTKMDKEGYIHPNTGLGNAMWKGNNVGYKALHEYIKNHLPKPDKCQSCSLVKKLDLANISGEYKRDLSDWEYICRKCHMIKDGRMEKLNDMRREILLRDNEGRIIESKASILK